MEILPAECVSSADRPGHKMNKYWTLTLGNQGFTGVTFSKRSDVKYGIRPIPYYEIDGDLELLEEIKNQLFKYGVNATLTETKYFNALQIIGIDNCLILAEVIGIDDNWADSLHDDFQKGTHRTEKGIKKLFIEFGTKSLLTYDEVCAIIDAAKINRLDKTLQKIITGRKKLTLLPAYDSMYNQIDAANMPCMRCRKLPVKIYFVGKYPRQENIFFLCDKCATQVIKVKKSPLEDLYKKINTAHKTRAEQNRKDYYNTHERKNYNYYQTHERARKLQQMGAMRYRARKMGAEGTHTLEEWEALKKEYIFRCAACGEQEPVIKLTEDHIKPLSIGGSNCIDNIQPLCRTCNCKKGINFLKYNLMPRSMP